MDENEALTPFSALGQPTRLAVLRLFVHTQPDGLAAGEIAARLAVRPNTLSSNLAQFEAAGLILGHREGRSIRYTARGPMTPSEAAIYIIAQIIGVLGTFTAHGMFAQEIVQFSPTRRIGPLQWFAEIMATLGLVLTIFGGLRARPEAVPRGVADGAFDCLTWR